MSVPGERQNPPLVSVVILNHNGSAIMDLVRRSVQAVLAQDYPSIELILVDDNSTDGSDQQVRALGEQVGAAFASTREGRRHGVGTARNAGLCLARGDYVAFLDNDAIPQQGWLSALTSRMLADPGLGACASRVMFADKPDIVNSMGSVLNELFHGNGVCIHEMYEFASWPATVMYATGNGLMLRRRAIEQVGTFDEGYLLWGADDADYGMRLWRGGWRIVPVADAVVHHQHSFTKKQKGMPFWDGRNRVRMALKHLSWAELFRFLPLDLLYNARWSLFGHYLRCWWSTLTDWEGMKGLLAYRWQHRGGDPYARFFRERFSPPHRLLVAPDNRAFGREMVPLQELRVGVNDEPHLYHGWYWVEHWGKVPMRWAMGVASLVGSLPDGAQALRWRLLPRPGADQARLSVIVQRRGEAGHEEAGRLKVNLAGGASVGPKEVATPCELPPGDYRFVLQTDQALVESGPFPRKIGFGLAGLVVESGGERA